MTASATTPAMEYCLTPTSSPRPGWYHHNGPPGDDTMTMRTASYTGVAVPPCCPVAPRRSKQIFGGDAKRSLLDNLEILEAPFLNHGSSSLSSMESSSSSSSKRSNFDWSFHNSQRSFYASSSRRESLRRLRQGNALERLVRERQAHEDEEEEEEAAVRSSSPEYDDVEETTNIIRIDDFLSPPTQASQTVGQTILLHGQDPSPTGVMDFVEYASSARPEDDGKKTSNTDNHDGDDDDDGRRSTVGGLPSLEAL